MRYCEFAEDVSNMTGVSKEICSQIWVQTIAVLKKDFTSVEKPAGNNPKELYYFFRDKRLGLRFGPLRLCMNTYAILRKLRLFKRKNKEIC